MANKNETLFLVAVRGTKADVIKEGIASILTAEGKKLKKEPQWRGYYFQIRSKDGFKAKPIWPEGKKL